MRADNLAVFGFNSAVVATETRLTVFVLGVARAFALETNLVDNGVLLAVDENVDDFEEVAARLALNPKLVARRAPERRHTLLDGGFEREFVDVADDENFARIGTLRNRGNDILGTLCDFLKLCKIEL